MKEYTVVYIKNDEEYFRDTYNGGTTIADIVEELTYKLNRYGKYCDYITIFDANEVEDIVYFKVVNIDCKYQLEAIGRRAKMYVLKAIGERISNGKLEKCDIYITAPTINECFVELVKYKSSSDLYIKVDDVYLA